MGIAEQLEEFQTAADGCSLVAFGDRQTRLMLRVNSDTPWPQEKLDALCGQGADCFELAASEALAGHFGTAKDEPFCAIHMTARDVRLFFAAGEDDTDMICCVCPSGGHIADVTGMARTLIGTL